MIFDDISSPTDCRVVLALCDIAGFLKACRNKSNREIFAMLDEFYGLVGRIVDEAGGRVVKFMGDGALIVFPKEVAKVGVESLRRLKKEADGWSATMEGDMHLNIKAHIGTVVCGPLGTAEDKRFDVIGNPVMELFTMASGQFVLSGPLEQILKEQ